MHQSHHLVVPTHPVIVIRQGWPCKWIYVGFVISDQVITLDNALRQLRHIVGIISRVRMHNLLHYSLWLCLLYNLNCRLLTRLTHIFLAHGSSRWYKPRPIALVCYNAAQVSVPCVQVSWYTKVWCITSRCSFSHGSGATHDWILGTSVESQVLSVLITHLRLPCSNHSTKLVLQRCTTTTSTEGVISLKFIQVMQVCNLIIQLILSLACFILLQLSSKFVTIPRFSQFSINITFLNVTLIPQILTYGSSWWWYITCC